MYVAMMHSDSRNNFYEYGNYYVPAVFSMYNDVMVLEFTDTENENMDKEFVPVKQSQFDYLDSFGTVGLMGKELSATLSDLYDEGKLTYDTLNGDGLSDVYRIYGVLEEHNIYVDVPGLLLSSANSLVRR